MAGIRPGIRVSHLNNFATLLDLMDVPMSLRVHPYEKSFFSLTPEDKLGTLLYERLSSWIRRLRGKDDTYTTR